MTLIVNGSWAKSPYYTNKPEKLKSIYKEDCMHYLTFLDYLTVESVARNTDVQLKALRSENELLRAQMRDEAVTNDDAITVLSDQLRKVNERLTYLEEKQSK